MVAEIGKLTNKKVSHTNLFSCEGLSSRSLRSQQLAVSNWRLPPGDANALAANLSLQRWFFQGWRWCLRRKNRA